MKQKVKHIGFYSILAAFLLQSSPMVSLSRAADVEEIDRKEYTTGKQTGTAFSLFLGLGGGYYNTNAKDLNLSGNLDGYLFQGTAIASLYTPGVVIDMGAGWLYNNMKGDQYSNAAKTRTAQFTTITRSGFGILSPRFRFDQKRWEFGPIGTFWFGNSDPMAQSETSIPIFLGLNLIRNFSTDNLQFRVGMQALTDVNLNSRQGVMGLLTFELGIPLTKGETIVREITKKETVETVVVQEIVNFTFDEQAIHFEYNKANLTKNSRGLINDIAQFLVDNPTTWESMTVTGHTDNRGSLEYNQKLSEQRAKSVKDALVQAGVPADRIEAIGQGETKPIDPSENDLAWARNRRVEMNFKGVKEPKLFRDNINRARLKNVRPEL